jgi:hypothetical protein
MFANIYFLLKLEKKIWAKLDLLLESTLEALSNESDP